MSRTCVFVDAPAAAAFAAYIDRAARLKRERERDVWQRKEIYFYACDA